MKNLLIYTRPDNRFSTENKMLAKVQIDNAIDLGWKREDILLFTNFPYHHNGVSSKVVPDLSYKHDRTNKIPAIVYLLRNKLLPDDLIWYHDFDAFQDYAPLVVDLENYDIGFTGYGYKPQWNCGSFFFKLSAQDIFEFWNSKIIPRNRADEKTLTDITNEGGLDRTRYTELNLTYNFGQRIPSMPEIYKKVDKPIKVMHFHPYYTYYKSELTNFEIFMEGKLTGGIPVMSLRFINIFRRYGRK